MPNAPRMKVLHIQKVGVFAGSEHHLLDLLSNLRVYGWQPQMLVLADRHDRPEPFIVHMQKAGIPTDLMPVRGDMDPMVVASLNAFDPPWTV